MNRPVVLLGAGVLGRRIATLFLAGGFDVHIRDPSPDSLAAAADYIAAHVESYFRLTKSASIGTVSTFTDIEPAVKDAWLVIEAVPEDLDLKISTFAELNQFAPNDCILASNSSSFKSRLMVTELDEETKKRVLNMHFTMPPEIRTVELMTSGQTDEALFEMLSDVLTRCGMVPVTARKESTGFIFNRLWAAIKREILLILSEGVSEPTEIDILWKNMFQSPHSLPPCRLMDQIGLDTVAFIEDNYIDERGLDTVPVDWLRSQYTQKGKLGLKSGGGLFNEPFSGHTANDLKKNLYILDVGLGGNASTPVGSGRILRLNLMDNTVHPIVTGQNLPDGIAISQSTRRFFWSNVGRSTATYDGSIHSSNLDGTDIQTVLPTGSVHTPKQLLVDDDSRKIYFCDREGMSIHRCGFDGSDHEILLSRGNPRVDKKDMTQWCVGVAIDTVRGHMYWTQKGPSKGGQGRIFRAGLNIPASQTGENRSDIELLLEGLPEPIDLDLDESREVLYWTDRGEHPKGCSLNRLNLTDRKMETVARQFHEPIGLKVDGEDVYVADLGGCIYRVSLKGEKTVVHCDDGSYTGICMG
ncbi:hypothetical protein ASPWEDRAFT_108355 [Aspergillus wentii DTO 134E9]|uniref:3-hydroxyacyl-CoA dehydrogenase NAD binding domain-containing protein n=1 Tax=Aspergillus wentii DTO 134E9 TaxID=1073089 RepID=A0A1L9RMV2_ASPWE|nr:uncharacterized protein ASPWEDRAFT_108355 [Aspergillus wentii DTO 134E9]OJJ36279.1 hypothetical protein ASPWEDRAFT_108355 [Aspergillus wentii DTO 134E9]